MKKAALWYAKHNWRIFPIWPIRDGSCGCGDPECKSPGKHPIEHLTGNWKKSGTNNLATIERWWTAVPDANIATMDYLRIDVDTRGNGSEHWQDLISQHGRPDTWHCLTPSGGEHWYFRPPDGWNHSNELGNLPSGIDVRGHGTGYTLLPPSNHLDGIYEWELSSRPDEMQIAPLPDWLATLLSSKNGRVQVDFLGSYGKPDLNQFHISEIIRATIMTEPDSSHDRSRIDQSVITGLVRAGATDDQILAVFEHYPIGQHGKFSDNGRHAQKYLAHSIGRARAYLDRSQGKQELKTVSPPLTPQQERQIQKIVDRISQGEYWRGYHDAMTQLQRGRWHDLGFTDSAIDYYNLGYVAQPINHETGEILADSALSVPMKDRGGTIVNIEYRFDGRCAYEAGIPTIHYVEPEDKPLLLWPDTITAMTGYLHLSSMPYTFAGLPQVAVNADTLQETAVTILEPHTPTKNRGLTKLDSRFVRLPLPLKQMLARGATAETFGWYIKQARRA